ncbi:MAG: hypothetical protein G01um101448_1196 [Parcubacteria group bacterium Gr01-1014_48]|nr:MAG: hypothetical protein G01um101448_1196 [Parcubacteria group bacterium Gr01-1014_48]
METRLGNYFGMVPKDTYGNKIRFASNGTQGEYGWEIEHKNPVARGGSDNSNSRILHRRSTKIPTLIKVGVFVCDVALANFS